MQPIAEVDEVQDTVEPTPTLRVHVVNKEREQEQDDAQNNGKIDSDSEREDVSDDDITIYSMSSMGSTNVGTNNAGNNLRRRSPASFWTLDFVSYHSTLHAVS